MQERGRTGDVQGQVEGVSVENNDRQVEDHRRFVDFFELLEEVQLVRVGEQPLLLLV